VKYKTLVML